LTPAGQLLLGLANAILARATDAEEELRQLNDGTIGHLRVAAFVRGNSTSRWSSRHPAGRRNQLEGVSRFPAPKEGIAITHFIVSSDVERSRRFYTEVLGGEAVLEGELSIVALANGWVTISVGGGHMDDKPGVTLEPPSDPHHVSGFLNIRVADIAAVYEEWSARGAEFLTPPIDRGSEIRRYMRDADGHLIEVGQLVGRPEDRSTRHGRRSAFRRARSGREPPTRGSDRGGPRNMLELMELLEDTSNLADLDLDACGAIMLAGGRRDG
jgi:catechol 2,3-dioxygenase-like lactoylglutathione lyase family enzyme